MKPRGCVSSNQYSFSSSFEVTLKTYRREDWDEGTHLVLSADEAEREKKDHKTHPRLENDE